MRRSLAVLATAAATATAAVLMTALAPGNVVASQDRPALPKQLVIGHRGSSGYLPEHTLEAYGLAILQGADCIEPDLVATRDGVLVARHEPNLIATTDVSKRPEFADRLRTAVVDGVPEQGFFASDFTLAEIRSLRAMQTIGGRFTGLDGAFRVPTFDEVIALAKRKTEETGRTICVYPETKHPTYHAELGLPLEDRLVRALARAGWNTKQAPVFVQSFETANLRYLNTRTPVRLVQLIDANDVNLDGSLDFTAPYDRPYDLTVAGDTRLYSDLVTPKGLKEIATYADGIGPWKPYVISSAGTDADGDGAADDVNGDGSVNDADRRLLPPTDLVRRAHNWGLLVHPYTFRSEQRRLAADYAGEPTAEYRAFFAAGVDGLFSDFPDDAFAGRTQYLLDTRPSLGRCLWDSTALPGCNLIVPRS